MISEYISPTFNAKAWRSPAAPLLPASDVICMALLAFARKDLNND
jgi:hypothetical protein